MSLYGMMRTGVSGMNAQANRLSSLSDNIANSSTTGYKRSSTEFETLVIPTTNGNYASGGVTTTVRNAISKQGDLKFTTSGTDLAVNGAGFFIVQDPSGQTFMTRAGNFVPDDTGKLVNAAGFTLMGYSFANGTPAANANGFGGLEPVMLAQEGISATPSTSGVFTANLNSDAAVVPAADLPSANGAGATYSSKSSLVSYDNLGTQVLLDVYTTKTGANTWEVAVYNKANAAPNTSFPYTTAALTTQTLNFDPANGQLATASPKDITIAVPGGKTLKIDLSKTTQLAQAYTVTTATVDGAAPSPIDTVDITADGTVVAQFANGSAKELYRIPLADVQSPDQLNVLAGNVFSQSYLSGAVTVGFPQEGVNGTVVSSALESSNVDIGEELTTMIESQRSYTANSKSFQTGADLMDILINLKR